MNGGWVVVNIKKLLFSTLDMFINYDIDWGGGVDLYTIDEHCTS